MAFFDNNRSYPYCKVQVTLGPGLNRPNGPNQPKMTVKPAGNAYLSQSRPEKEIRDFE